jgi:hypothetical protein
MVIHGSNIGVSAIPNSFIERFCQLDGMVSAKVEYELFEIDCPDNILGCEVLHQKYRVRVAPDNTIFIKE